MLINKCLLDFSTLRYFPQCMYFQFISILKWITGLITGRGVTGIFFLRGQSQFFLIFSLLQSPSIFNFPPFPFYFPSFLLKFPPFQFFLPSFSPIGQEKFPGQKSLAGTLPPPPACYATDYRTVSISMKHRWFGIYTW